MGYGDWIMASAEVRGHFDATGRKVAFGDGRNWELDQQVFAGNPNVATGAEMMAGIGFDWHDNYRGHRPYIDYAASRPGRFAWRDWQHAGVPGELFFSESERLLIEANRRRLSPYLLIEPTVKPTASNKQWSPARYQQVAAALAGDSVQIVQCGPLMQGRLDGVEYVQTRRFRDALLLLAGAQLYVGPEGGMHHAAAALDIPAVVVFGGFVHPRITGYAAHVNLSVGEEGCGMLTPCPHCRDAMDQITVDMVVSAARGLLNG